MGKNNSTLIQFNIPIDKTLKEKFKLISKKETERTGYKVTHTEVARKILEDYVESYDLGK